MQRAFANILTDSIEDTASFYENLLGMHRHFTSDWFIILTHPQMPGYELGILDRSHAVVPEPARESGGTMMMTFVVNDIGGTEEIARHMGAVVVEPPRRMDYGQTRMIVRDPAGTLVDLSAPTP